MKKLQNSFDKLESSCDNFYRLLSRRNFFNDKEIEDAILTMGDNLFIIKRKIYENEKISLK